MSDRNNNPANNAPAQPDLHFNFDFPQFGPDVMVKITIRDNHGIALSFVLPTQLLRGFIQACAAAADKADQTIAAPSPVVHLA